jgi:small-conductance mechanosensitive channel
MNQLLGRLAGFFTEHWASLLYPAILFFAVAAAGWLFRRYAFRALRRAARRTAWKLDDVIVDSLHTPVLLWLIILALYVATRFSELPRGAAGAVARILLGLWIVSITLALAKLSGRLVRSYAARLQGALPMSTVTEVLVSLVVGVVGLLTLLNAFDVPITPLLTTLGVGGLAVALALQDTLTNFFAGFYISLAGQIRVGDFIEIESGQTGYVTDIGWRSTTLRQLSNNLVVIPNNKLSQSIVTNYHLPDRTVAVWLPVGVSYESDPEHVERVLLDVLRQAQAELPEICRDPPPSVRFRGFGESSLDFNAGCRVHDYEQQFAVQHELRKRIFHRFRQEGISIPFPVRTVEFRNRPPQ